MTTNIQMPVIRFPFTSRMNQHAEAAQQHITEWVNEMGLLTSEKAWQRFHKARFAYLVARAFPDAGLHELCLIADFNTWLFILDDKCDEAAEGRKADYLRSIMAGLLDILQQNIEYLPASGHPLSAALSSIWERMRKLSNPGWRLRFIKTVNDYFSACIWEAENREAGIIPSLEDYIKMRPFTGALLADIEAIEIIEKVVLPQQVTEQALLQRMIQAGNNLVCWTNDIFSCLKESKQGDVHNLVLVLQHENGYSLQDAVNEATRMLKEEVAIFVTLEKLLPLTGSEADYELIRFVAVLHAWIVGNAEWSIKDTGRYGVASLAALAYSPLH
ncbi:hypothetical protein DVR12_15430 [Chitinophaga silvatica]|uniref:Terpene synthase n=1 Tax=Chitinophaga silvatica TaxID=2282649 RepID=A0A3E1Y9F6_9BACT|nr:hypothetical protein [Chitinophaga silvatica]RFS22032.1 hypothetical protein DVR12_15430 [Chitinophaga silvatica]